jgi:hypothetical protein
VNCIGFSITIISIQLINLLMGLMNHKYIYMILAIGPLIGLIVLYDKDKQLQYLKLFSSPPEH